LSMIKATRRGRSATVPGTKILSNYCWKRVASIQEVDLSN